MTKKYKVTVEFSGTRTYIIPADSPSEVREIFEQHGSFDHAFNSVDDRMNETLDIIELENDDA